MASSAAAENQATPVRWPGEIANAASSGPSAPPMLPDLEHRLRQSAPGACREMGDARTFGMERRRADADQRRGCKQKRISRRQREPDQADEGEHHAGGQRIRDRPAVGKGADQGLQQRRCRLIGEGNEPDMGKVEIEGRFQVGIDRRQERLHHVVQRVAESDGEEHREHGRMHLHRCGARGHVHHRLKLPIRPRARNR